MPQLQVVDPALSRLQIEQVLNDVVDSQWAAAQENIVITIPEDGPNQGSLVLYNVPGVRPPLSGGIVVETFDQALTEAEVQHQLDLEESQDPPKVLRRFYGKTSVSGQPQWLALLDKQEMAPNVQLGQPAQNLQAAIQQIVQIAAGSPIMNYRWENRGRAYAGYIKGMAVVYARVYCKWKANDPAVLEMAKANTWNGRTDALAWYSERFEQEGMNNAVAGADTLRHLFVLLIGLGMRESSGRYCEGRDASADNVSADTAEAGPFQTSFNARSASPLMKGIFDNYVTNHPEGFLDIFKEGVHAKPSDLRNWGVGQGVVFQALSKSNPAFATEFAAVGLRNIRRHWGPINNRAAEIRPDCDAMLLAVQNAVDAGNLCPI